MYGQCKTSRGGSRVDSAGVGCNGNGVNGANGAVRTMKRGFAPLRNVFGDALRELVASVCVRVRDVQCEGALMRHSSRKQTAPP